MRLTFRQGIARYQTDVYATPTFLAKSSQSGEFVDLIVSPDPTIVIFAHKNATYVIEETKTIQKAWGPFPGQGTRYLYWDINLLDASVSRGFTNLPQIVSASTPTNPTVDQHWFDTQNHQMKVWNGSKWIDKVRVFAAIYSSQSVLQAYPLGTQAGENGSFEGGNLILDSYNKPLRQSDGTFVTSSTELALINASSKKVKFESEVISGMASENIPKFSFVQADRDKKFKLGRSGDWRSRIIGVVTEDLYQSEIGNVETSGLIRNEQWHWPATSIGRPVFCGESGQVTLVPPTIGVLQIGGYVFDENSIFVNVEQATILTDLTGENIPVPNQPVGRKPSANFTANPMTGEAPMTVSFTSTSLYEPTSWDWDFNGDGKTDSTKENPTYTYTTAGSYTVRLKVKNTFGEDEMVKTHVITVDPATPDVGINTNLSIQLNAPRQVTKNQEFTVTVTSANVGFKPGTRVLRTIYIDDVNGTPVAVTAKPTGTSTVSANNQTLMTFPLLPTLASGQVVNTTFSIRAPNALGVISIRAGIVSPELDSTLSDNVAALTIRIK